MLILPAKINAKLLVRKAPVAATLFFVQFILNYSRRAAAAADLPTFDDKKMRAEHLLFCYFFLFHRVSLS